MLIAHIHTLFSKLSQHRCQSSRALASYGIIGQDYQVISESGFNQLINSVDQSRIIHHDNNTLICDTKDRVHALIKAPYFDLSGQSHPVRYFALKNAKLSQLNRLKLHAQHTIKRLVNSILAKLKKRPKRPLKTNGNVAQPVWTTIRLTA